MLQYAEPKSDMPNTPKPPEKLVRALASGIQIVRYLGSDHRSAGVSQIARDLQINPSTCFHLLKTLVYERLVLFDSATKTYSLGLGVVELAKGALRQNAYVRMLRPHLEAIALAHTVTVTLWERVEEDRVVLVDYVEAAAAIRVNMSLGQRLPATIAALGRCIAAHSNMSTAQLRKMFPTLRWQDPPTIGTYLAEVEGARRNGYAIDPGNYVRGVTTVSAPVLDGNGRPIMAISAVGFSAQLEKPELLRLAADVRDRAREASRALSGGPVSGHGRKK